MTPTNEELLRLARKVFPQDDWDSLPLKEAGKVTRLTGAVTMHLRTVFLAPGSEEIVAKQRQAIHAALLVLSGELNVSTVWQAMCTAEQERDLHLKQLLELERGGLKAAIEQGAANERERIRAAIGVLIDEMRRGAEAEGMEAEGDEGMYRDEIATLRTLERRYVNQPSDGGEYGGAGG